MRPHRPGSAEQGAVYPPASVPHPRTGRPWGLEEGLGGAGFDELHRVHGLLAPVGPVCVCFLPGLRHPLKLSLSPTTQYDLREQVEGGKGRLTAESPAWATPPQGITSFQPHFLHVPYGTTPLEVVVSPAHFIGIETRSQGSRGRPTAPPAGPTVVRRDSLQAVAEWIVQRQLQPRDWATESWTLPVTGAHIAPTHTPTLC